MGTLRRLLGFLRPYRAGAVWSVVLAAFATAGTVAIPWLTGRAIDGLEAGDKDDLRRYAALDAVLAGREVKRAETPARGCTVKWKD